MYSLFTQSISFKKCREYGTRDVEWLQSKCVTLKNFWVYCLCLSACDVGQNLLFNFCNYLILLFLCKKKKNVILGLGDLFPCIFT